MMKKLLTFLLFAIPMLAQAHPGGHGIASGMAWFHGFTHPFSGVDHLLAMVLVGIWSAQCFHHHGRRAWCLPLVFAALLFVGGWLGVAGTTLPVEAMIALSLAVFGLLVARRGRYSLALGAMLSGVFALFHGIAHGLESTAGSPLLFLLGMTASTLLLHLAGMALGHGYLLRHHRVAQALGLGVAFWGLSLLAA